MKQFPSLLYPWDGCFLPHGDMLTPSCQVWGSVCDHILFCSVDPEIHGAICCEEEQQTGAVCSTCLVSCPYIFKFLHKYISYLANQAAGFFLSFFNIFLLIIAFVMGMYRYVLICIYVCICVCI